MNHFDLIHYILYPSKNHFLIRGIRALCLRVNKYLTIDHPVRIISCKYERALVWNVQKL